MSRLLIAALIGALWLACATPQKAPPKPPEPPAAPDPYANPDWDNPPPQ